MATIDHSAPSPDPIRAYRRPDPVLVARIFDEYGPHAAYERWGSLSEVAVGHLAAAGRRIIRKGKPS